MIGSKLATRGDSFEACFTYQITEALVNKLDIQKLIMIIDEVMDSLEIFWRD